MVNIVRYFASFLNVIFGYFYNSFLLTPDQLFTTLQSVHDSALASTDPLSYWFSYLLSHFYLVFPVFLWSWFAWLTFHLLLIWPFKWIRSVVKR